MNRTSLACFLSAAIAGGCAERDTIGSVESPLGTGTFENVASFGTNPGALKMYRYVPSPEPTGPAPLVLAFHACSQDATTYRKSGWEELADRYGFYLVYPEQQTANNALRCFNWAGEYSDPTNLRRGEGENQSIKEMVDQMKADFDIDDARVFAVGHSGGGAQVALMLSVWPELFAGGGIMAGVPFNCTTEFARVSSCLTPGVDRTPAQWGDLVRAANPGYAGSYPRLSIWHGSADGLVTPNNLREILEQFADAHGIDTTADSEETIGTATHKEYNDARGRTQIETYLLEGASHGTFVDPDMGCGMRASYIIDVDMCAARYMAEFFGIAESTGPLPGTDAGPPVPGTDAGPGTIPIDDIAPPLVDVIAPSDGDVVAGETTIVVDAHDEDDEVDRVVIRIDGADLFTIEEPPYRVRWDATGAGAGTHRIAARAYDRTGNERVDDDTVVRVLEGGRPIGGDAGTPGPGDPGFDPTDESLGCTCSSGGSSGATGMLCAGAIALWLARRRRRVTTRRRG
jgi:poly(hydroxyalkanoate) depolymerase family esterase